MSEKGRHDLGTEARTDATDEVVSKPASKRAAEQRELDRGGSTGSPDQKLTGELGDANFGDAASGGSVIGKRAPKDR